ncbi:hypothetical protein Acr_06g0002800 [Actinidia rufa]|uniref:Uncharacterized protein n=1 Tax=Actinidia rufa TaxID=165716 RepID=A0A7J0EPV8_9ERIC|nr:hypothetical protein Acr_06g0002800 [Actinidia rufa]
MGFSSTLSLYSHPNISFREQLRKHGRRSDEPTSVPYISRRRCLRLRTVVVKAASSGGDGGSRRSASSRRVYKQFQRQDAQSNVPGNDIASFIALRPACLLSLL